jgi:uncharacterized RDD family membrane protein YckC
MGDYPSIEEEVVAVDPVPASPEARHPVPPPEPVSPMATRAEDVLGLRISAALIDLIVLFVVFVVLCVTIGEARLKDGFSFYLEGIPQLAVLLVLVFFYYFALEATFGRTVGKSLLGLQVVGPDGGRPSLGATGVRTVLRVVDWLPLLYLVGFVTMMATGSRRQRLGDLAAGTTVAPALPVRRRGLAAALLVSGLLLTFVASIVSVAVRGDDYATFRADGASFDYPADWQDFTGDITYGTGGAGEIAAVGIAGHDFAAVNTFRMDRPVTAENLDAAAQEITKDFPRTWPGWTVQVGPEVITMGGLPSLRYEIEGRDVDSTLVYAFDDLTGYQLMCQTTAEYAAEIEQGCDQIIRTFQVE